MESQLLTWQIFKKVDIFKWEFVKHFPDPEAPQPIFRISDIHNELKMLSEMDNHRCYRAKPLIDEAVGSLETRVKTTLTYAGIIKEIVVVLK